MAGMLAFAKDSTLIGPKAHASLTSSYKLWQSADTQGFQAKLLNPLPSIGVEYVPQVQGMQTQSIHSPSACLTAYLGHQTQAKLQQFMAARFSLGKSSSNCTARPRVANSPPLEHTCMTMSSAR